MLGANGLRPNATRQRKEERYFINARNMAGVVFGPWKGKNEVLVRRIVVEMIGCK